MPKSSSLGEVSVEICMWSVFKTKLQTVISIINEGGEKFGGGGLWTENVLVNGEIYSIIHKCNSHLLS